MNTTPIVGTKLFDHATPLAPDVRKGLEVWVVNTVKLKMVEKLDTFVDGDGRLNAREVFLVPVFTVKELTDRVATLAPEITTLFFQELMNTVAEAEGKISA